MLISLSFVFPHNHQYKSRYSLSLPCIAMRWNKRRGKYDDKIGVKVAGILRDNVDYYDASDEDGESCWRERERDALSYFKGGGWRME